MKRRRLRAERLIGLAVRPKSRRDGHRHLIGARGQHRRRVGRGRGVAAPIVEPMLAKSVAAAAMASGAAITNDM